MMLRRKRGESKKSADSAGTPGAAAGPAVTRPGDMQPSSRTAATREKTTMRDRDTLSSNAPKAGGAVLSEDTELSGSLTFKNTLRIDGKFDGDIQSPGTIRVGKSGQVNAEITVGNATIEGKVNGNITAKGKVELLSTAQVTGDIKAERLAISEGMIFVGKCEVNPAKSKIEVLETEASQAAADNIEKDPGSESHQKEQRALFSADVGK